MKKIFAIVALLSASGFVLADTSWQPQSWSMKNGTVKTVLAGWELTHFPNSKTELLMVGRKDHQVAVITDYPDSLEVRAFVADSGEFVTLRDKDHDRRYEEVEGLSEGTILKLDGGSYKLTKLDGKWSLSSAP